MTGVEIAGVAGAAASLIGNGANVVAQGKLNKKNRKHQKEMYAQEVADKERQWHMTNEYNLPLNQIARLREAGLNPMMMYGQGAGAGGNASSEPNSASFQNYEDKPPNFDFSGIGQYVGFRNVAAQTDNTRANTAVAKAQEAKIKADTANTAADTINKSNLDQLQKRDLSLPAVETAQQQLEKLKAETTATNRNVEIAQQNADTNVTNADTNKRQADTAAYNATTNRMSTNSLITRNLELNKLTRAEVQRVKEVTKTQEFETSMKQIHSEITKMGGNPTDPGWQRAIWLYASKIFNLPAGDNNESDERGEIWDKYNQLDDNPKLDSLKMRAHKFYNSK